MSSEIKILCGQPTGTVRGKGKRYFTVIDRDIRMMIRLLSKVAHLIHEGEGFLEIAERKLLLNRFAFGQLPTGEAAKFPLHFRL